MHEYIYSLLLVKEHLLYKNENETYHDVNRVDFLYLNCCKVRKVFVNLL